MRSLRVPALPPGPAPVQTPGPRAALSQALPLIFTLAATTALALVIALAVGAASAPDDRRAPPPAVVPGRIPVFSHPAGFYEQPFELTLAIDGSDEGAIRYTLDGSEPDESSPAYTDPIPISSTTDAPSPYLYIETGPEWVSPPGDIFKGTVVRARVFPTDGPPGPVVTKTYFAGDGAAGRYSFPVISLVTDYANLFDHQTGIYVPGVHFDHSSLYWSGNYHLSGPEWERPAHIEFFEPNGALGFAQNVGIRIHGGITRSLPLKTFRVYARGEYDPANAINYQLFPDSEAREFKRLLLRQGGNEYARSMLTDVVAQSLLKPLALSSQYSRPAVLFINGEYWGIRNIRDRFDDWYLQSRYSLRREDVVILNWDKTVHKGVPGDEQPFLEMLRFVEDGVLRDESGRIKQDRDRWVLDDRAYAELRKMIDIDNYIDFVVAEVFLGNYDWPGNSWRVWRRRCEFDPEAPYGHDGRWRWAVYDFDAGFGGWGVEFDTLAHAALIAPDDPYLGLMPLSGPDLEWPWGGQSTYLLRALLTNESFRLSLITRYADLMNTVFRRERLVAAVEEHRSLYAPEIPEHIRRWGAPPSSEAWNDWMQRLHDFAVRRHDFARRHVVEHFDEVTGTATVTVDAAPGRGIVTVNSMRIDRETPGTEGSPYPFSGVYFTGVPVTVTARAEAGCRFVGWEGDLDEAAAGGESLTFILAGDVHLRAVFEEEPFAGDELNPAAHDLATGPYLLTEWKPDNLAGTYPPAVRFTAGTAVDPRLGDEMTLVYKSPYSIRRGTRIRGLHEDGLAFVNTAGAGGLGAAVLALRTTGLDDVKVAWRAGTVVPGSRGYAIRLQYRPGILEPFTDVIHEGRPVEYVSAGVVGHGELIGPVPLPAEACDRPYIQLRWKYYFTGEERPNLDGGRDMLSLDDIMVYTAIAPPEAAPPAVGLLVVFAGVFGLLAAAVSRSPVRRWRPPAGPGRASQTSG